MKRKYFITLLIIILTLTIILTGCKKTIEEKISEEITEKILEEATGSEVEIDSESATIKTDGGSTQIGGNIKWPEGNVGDLPELKTNLTMVIEDKENSTTLIYFDSLSNEDAQKYTEKLKGMGYEAVYETSSESSYSFQGNNGKGSEVVFVYYGDDGSGAITYAKVEVEPDEPEEDSVDMVEEVEEEIDMTDDIPWPTDFFGDIPEPEGKITQVNSNGSNSKSVYLEYVSKEQAYAHLEAVKEIGFTVDASESLGADYIDYSAYNENDDYISLYWNIDNLSISLDKVEE